MMAGFFDVNDFLGPESPWRTSADWEWMQFAGYIKPRWAHQGDGAYEFHCLVSLCRILFRNHSQADFSGF